MSEIRVSTKNVREVASEVVEDFMQDYLKTSIPATVTSVKNYESKQCVDVQTVITNIYDDGITTEPLNLQSIFVKLPEGNGFQVRLPIAVGDKVTLHYTHRSLNSWLEGTGSSVAEDIEMSFGNKDCYVTHGFGTRKVNQSPSATDMIITGNGITITLKPDGSYSTIASETTLTCPTNNIIGDVIQTGNSVMTGELEVQTSITTPDINAGHIVVETIESEGNTGVTGSISSDSGFTVTNGIVTAIG